MKEQNSFGYPIEPINILKFIQYSFTMGKEILFSKIFYLIVPIAILNSIQFTITTPLFKVNSELVADKLGEYILSLFTTNYTILFLSFLISILTFYFTITLISSIDDFIHFRKIDFNHTFKKINSRFFVSGIVSLVSVAFAFIPILAVALNRDNYSPYTFLAIFFASSLVIIALFFSKLLIVIRNISVINAFKASWKIIGFKYFIFVAIFNVIYGKTYQFRLNISTYLFDYPMICSIITLTAFGILLTPFLYSCKLYFLNDLTIRRTKVIK